MNRFVDSHAQIAVILVPIIAVLRVLTSLGSAPKAEFIEPSQTLDNYAALRQRWTSKYHRKLTQNVTKASSLRMRNHDINQIIAEIGLSADVWHWQ
jgi:hypothetical protein